MTTTKQEQQIMTLKQELYNLFALAKEEQQILSELIQLYKEQAETRTYRPEHMNLIQHKDDLETFSHAINAQKLINQSIQDQISDVKFVLECLKSTMKGGK